MVQPFSLAARLPRGVYDLDEGQIKALPVGRSQGQRLSSFAYALNELKANAGHTGLAWASRKEIIARHLLYDRLIIGGADQSMAYLLYGNSWNIKAIKRSYNGKTFKHLMNWANSLRKDTQGSIGYAGGILMHLWHGNKEERMHIFRNSIVFNLLDFDPGKDIRLSPDGFLEWVSDKPELHKVVEKYFSLRNEDGSKEPLGSINILRRAFNIIFFLPAMRRAVIFFLRKGFSLVGFVKRIVYP